MGLSRWSASNDRLLTSKCRQTRRGWLEIVQAPKRGQVNTLVRQKANISKIYVAEADLTRLDLTKLISLGGSLGKGACRSRRCT